MRLTQIKLAGFKSFVEPTTIPTPSALVGVVGPNGCGKSNIIDAVRWVLGETKASELRGASMQDVIFNGSSRRKPAARASVELVFDNSEGRAAGQWSTYAEIAVRRTLTRDGASSYFINGQLVRRRDIHDIFLGTGLGTRGYAIIGQGMINRLIEARPEELRVYLEEAAGVSRYKERRRETENRLSDTRENLQRLEDILRELSTQLDKLESQAEVAGRYRGLQQEGETKQHALWLLREASARNSQQGMAARIEQAQAGLEGAIAKLRACEADIETRRTGHFEANDAVHAAQGKVFEAGAQVSRLEAEIRHVIDSRNRLQARRGQLQAQLQEWGDQQSHCQTMIEEVEGQVDESAARAETLAQACDTAREQLPELDTVLREAAARRDGLRSGLSRTEQDLALAAQTQRDADGQLRTLVERRRRLHDEREALGAPDTTQIEHLAGECELAQARLQDAQDALLELEERLPGLEAERAQAQQASQDARLAVEKLDAQRVALMALQEDIQNQNTLEPWLQRQGLDSLGRLWQKLHIEPGWENALEAVLHERMNGLELRQLQIAGAFASDAPPARLAFYQIPESAAQPPVPPGVQPLASLLRATDPDILALLEQWLRGVYVSAGLDRALADRAALPEGACWVVREGHRVDAHSLRFYAADSEQSGMLARQQQIENLQREIKAGQLIADQALADQARAESACHEVSRDLVPARRRIAELMHGLHENEIELHRLRQQAQQSGERAQRIEGDLAEIAAQYDELEARRDEAEQRFQTLDEALAGQQDDYATIDLQCEDLAQRAEQARQAVRDQERAAQEADYATRGLHSRIDELRRTLQLAGEQARRSGIELESLQGELFELDESVAEAGLQQAVATRTELEDTLRTARIRQDDMAAALRQADEERLAIEQSLEPLRTGVTELQLQEQAARLAVEQFSEQLDAHQVDRAALRRFIDEQPQDWSRIGWLQSEVQRITRQIESLGAVNLAALDELGAARERKT
ncbi:MAG: chromosome segregation protein SMC, partial [Alcaligenaceae bacterium]|nr:chromosome segregation protein SMC [Alcaligenaceae bacterium]